jgi:phytol kinase
VKVAGQLLLIALSVGGLLAAMACVHALARRFGWSAELQRKCVHIATGLYALSLPLTFGEAWPVLLLCAVSVLVMGLMRLPALANSGIGSTIHGVERKSYGEILLAVSVGFLFYRSIGNPVLFVLPMLVLTFSDAAAALTGVRYGRRLFAVEDGTKSLEGVVMFFLITFIIAMITLLLMTDVPKTSVILLSLIVAAFGAEIEANSWRGLDNLFVPVGLHLFLQNNLETPVLGLLGGAVMFLGILAGLLIAAPDLGLTRHAARSYGVLVFLILSVTAAHNAVMPLAAFVTFLILRRIEPCESDYPELDFIAATASAAALWLFLGEWSGNNAINLYNLTFAGMATVFSTLALRHNRAFASWIIAAGLGLTVYALQWLNVEESRWVTAFGRLIIASLVLCAVLPNLRPALFKRYRNVKAFAVAITVPLLTFATKSLVS